MSTAPSALGSAGWLRRRTNQGHTQGGDAADSPFSVKSLMHVKQSALKRVMHPTKSSGSLLLEHWGFDKNGAERTWITTQEEFGDQFSGALKSMSMARSISPSGRHRGKGQPSSAHNVEERSDRQTWMGLKPLPKPSELSPSKRGEISSPNVSFLATSPVYDSGATGEKHLGHGSIGKSLTLSKKTVFCPYQDIKGKKPQRGEWFHSFGVQDAILKKLREETGVREEHLDLARDAGTERAKVEFVQGNIPDNDYIFILAHELKLEAPEARKRRELQGAKKLKAFVEGTMFDNFGSIFHGRSNKIADETGPEGNTSAVSGTNGTADPVTDGELEANKPTVLGSRTLAKAAGDFSDFFEGLAADEDTEPDVDVEKELEKIEEHQVVIFFFPERNLLFSIGDLDTKGPLVKACRATLLNPKSAVLSDLLGDADGSDGCGTLMVVMLDSCIDQVFPIMDVYGDALEGLRILCQEGPKYHHIKVSNFLKSHVMHIRRYLWDARGLFMELSQDMCGAMGTTSRVRVLNLLESTAQLEKEAEANIEQCHEVEVLFAAWQDTLMNNQLFWLTNLSVIMIPVQTLTGWFGMNFAPPDGLLALDGNECNLADHWPWDPCTYLMPELGYEYSYYIFVAVVLSWLIFSFSFLYIRIRPAKDMIVKTSAAAAHKPRSRTGSST